MYLHPLLININIGYIETSRENDYGLPLSD